MTAADQCRFALQTVVAQLSLQWRGNVAVSDDTRRRWGLLDPDRIELPDTPTVARALELVQQSVPVWLFRHSRRTCAWAALLAQRDALKLDAEVLAVSCLLHDVALLPYGGPAAGRQCACFAVDGGQRSRLFLQAQGWAESRALVVEDAICLHMNPHVPLGAGIEAHLLQQAAALDVVGARMAAIDHASRQAVLARYPRTGFAQQMSEAMRKQAERAPSTRTRLLWWVGFERAIRHSSWRECPFISEPPPNLRPDALTDDNCINPKETYEVRLHRRSVRGRPHSPAARPRGDGGEHPGTTLRDRGA
jgi:hypothetical protein